MITSIEELYRVYNRHPQISTDTRTIKQGSIFFCLKGSNYDGNRFAEEAIDKGGAAFAVIDDINYRKDNRYLYVEDSLAALQELAIMHRSRLKIPVLAITGSNGKTTTKELINAVLKEKYRTIATSGNFNNHIGVPLTLLSVGNDAEIAIIEMGANHIGEIAGLCRIAKPNYGIITNIGRAHIEGFGSYENIIKAKNELYEYIISNKGILFVNSDNKLLMQLSENSQRLLYGNDSDCRGRVIENNPFLKAGITINTVSNTNEFQISTNIIGDYNLENILAAISIGSYFKVPYNKIADAISKYTPSGYRSQLIETGRNKVILDCYNANPTSMRLAIKNFEDMLTAGKIAIIGDMFELGKASAEEHTGIINFLEAKKFEKVLLVGPQFAQAMKIKGTKINTSTDIEILENTDACYDYLMSNPVNDKTILIKGSRGMSLEKIIECL